VFRCPQEKHLLPGWYNLRKKNEKVNQKSTVTHGNGAVRNKTNEIIKDIK
jgi:hypothetical protein